MREESVNFDTTENLIIEGDNLEVLKLLQKSYFGKVRMIYIDPPYNTGNEFIYPDNYREGLQEYLRFSGQVDAEGHKLTANAETDGRYHSKWLSMMYPRLFMARNLLRDDGVIFVSIDDNEVHNLRGLINEVFGEENFLAQIIWQKMYSGKADATHFSRFHEYVLCYAKNNQLFDIRLLPRTEEMNARYTNPDNDPRGPWLSNDLTAAGERSAGHYIIYSPSGGNFDSPLGKHWLYAKETMEGLLADNRIYFGRNGNAFPRLKRFLSEVQQGRRVDTVWLYDEVGHTDEATKEIKKLFSDSNTEFQTPKPTRLISQILRLTTVSDRQDIVLDFFAGSGTTAQTVIELNAEDAGNRNFILVQLPEKTENPEYPTIAHITRERVRRVIKRLNGEDSEKLDLEGSTSQDRGFKAFKLSSSNFNVWDGTAEKIYDVDQILLDSVNHIDSSRTQEDILYELVLKAGFPLTTKVEKISLAGSEVYSIAEGASLICLEEWLTMDAIEAMIEMEPSQILCLDQGFQNNDQLKVNAIQAVKSRNRNQESDIIFRVV